MFNVYDPGFWTGCGVDQIIRHLGVVPFAHRHRMADPFADSVLGVSSGKVGLCGVTSAHGLELRFLLQDSPYVSGPRTRRAPLPKPLSERGT